MPLSRGHVVAGVAIAAVAVAVIAGLVVAGSPSEARFQRLDDRRVQDLSQAVEGVIMEWNRSGSLPASLEAAGSLAGSSLVDPTSRQPYEYRVTGAKTFEVCAIFDRDSLAEPSWQTGRGSWRHGPGRQCFPREASKP